MRWPIGEDTVHTIRLREAMTDIEWEERLRGDGKLYRAAFFRNVEEPPAKPR